MYIGDTTLKGLHHLVYEVVDNSIDEAMAGMRRLSPSSSMPTDRVTVEDDGVESRRGGMRSYQELLQRTSAHWKG